LLSAGAADRLADSNLTSFYPLAADLVAAGCRRCRVTARLGPTEFPHRAYIEALAEARENSPAWHVIIAGYAALQLFEGWADACAGAPAPSTLEVRRVRKYIDAVPEGHAMRRCLTQLVDSIEGAAAAGESERVARNIEVGRLLSAYAKLLQYDAQWGLAADVHSTVIGFSPYMEDTERLLESMLMRGFSLRMQGRLDEASEAYAAMRATAVSVNSERYRLESLLCDAKIAVDRGNFPVARELLDRTIADARRSDCSVIVSKGLTDRARVAAMQGDFELSLACSYEALERSEDQMDRERILGNIALTFGQMGLRDAARDAGLLVAATAQDRSARLAATVNLMELAYQDGRELVFEQYRRELAREELTPYLRASFLEASAEGLSTFGRHREAKAAREQMLEVAEGHGLHEFVIKAEAALRDEPHPSAVGPEAESRTPPAVRRTEPSTRVATIVRAIADMRIAAGLSA
jgi:tetratricopeptide (TPR) repeat protein